MSRRGVVRVATCQFAVTANIRRNAEHIRRQIRQARRRRADVVHFPETALSGYAGASFDTWDGFNWDALKEETLAVCELAREKSVWVILGSTHRLSGSHLPHNSVYVINAKGKIVERYDKCFCTGSDLRFYSPGNHLSVFPINGVKCGVLICYDVRFPELFRAYKKRGIQLLFHSFHNAGRGEKGANIWTTIMTTTMQARAATNYFWVSGNNSSRFYSSWPSVLIRPNGEIADRLRFNRPGITVNTVDTNKKHYDASALFRDRSMRGILHSGCVVSDPRSRDRTCF